MYFQYLGGLSTAKVTLQASLTSIVKLSVFRFPKSLMMNVSWYHTKCTSLCHSTETVVLVFFNVKRVPNDSIVRQTVIGAGDRPSSSFNGALVHVWSDICHIEALYKWSAKIMFVHSILLWNMPWQESTNFPDGSFPACAQSMRDGVAMDNCHIGPQSACLAWTILFVFTHGKTTTTTLSLTDCYIFWWVWRIQ